MGSIYDALEWLTGDLCDVEGLQNSSKMKTAIRIAYNSLSTW